MTSEQLAALLSLTNEKGQPNINALWRITKDIEAIKLNLKFFGYELARQLAEHLPVRADLEPVHAGLGSKACTQADMESDWAAYWCGQLRAPLLFHRKLWEFAYVLQVLHEAGKLAPGARAIGFGCGEEPIASHLVSRGVSVTITDLPPADRVSAGWAKTHQHASELRKAHRPDLVEEDEFLQRAELEYVDMRAIPPHLTDFDFCWSICALEHLGSIRDGMDFIENSLKVLKPGGVSVHTTEFNYLNDNETLDNWPTVLFQKKHFQDLSDRIAGAGHQVGQLDFDIGTKPMDMFIDVPPYAHDWPDVIGRHCGERANHLKLAIDGFASTCFGLWVRKAG